MGPIFTDPSVSTLPAFRYMAPVYDLGDSEIPMATYRKMVPEPDFNYSSVIARLETACQGQKKSILISDNDSSNLNIIAQCFEINDDSIGKMAVIDFGTYKRPDGSDAGSIYHIGKLFRDSNNVPKFVRIFTIVFE